MTQRTVVFGIPVTIWANSVALFLPLPDLLTLRLASIHFSVSLVEVIAVYHRRMQWEAQALASDVDYQRLISLISAENAQAAEALKDLRHEDLCETMAFCRPPRFMLDTAAAMTLLVEGYLEKDRWSQFLKISFLVASRLRELSPYSPHLVKHRAKFEEFLATVELDKAKRWRPAECFLRALPHFFAIAGLRSPEFDRNKNWEDYIQVQGRAAHRFLQRQDK